MTVSLPPRMDFEANEAVMTSLQTALEKKLPRDSFRLCVCFEDAHSGKYLENQKFLIALDTSVSIHRPIVENILKAHGLKEGDFKVSVCPIFLRAAINDEGDRLLADISDKYNIPNDAQAFGRHNGWFVDTTEHHWNSEPTLMLWFKDADLLSKVVGSKKFPCHISVSTHLQTNVPVSVYYTLTN